MDSQIEPDRQMVVELFVSNLKQSSEFYLNFGFTITQKEGSRMELKRQDAELYLMEVEKAPSLSDRPVGRLRLEVPNVDAYWSQAQRLGIPIYEALEERDSGIRDFTVTGPDGLGLQFVSTISK